MSKYKYRGNFAAPISGLDNCNQLALLLGESPDDDKTFTAASGTIDGIPYAIASAKVTDTFIYFTENLPDGRMGANMEMARAAHATLNQPGGLLIVYGDDPKAAFDSMGFIETVSEFAL